MSHRPFFLTPRRPGHPAPVPLPPGGTRGVSGSTAIRTVWPLSRRLRPSEARYRPITPTAPRKAAHGRPAARDSIGNALRLVLFTVAAVGYVACAAGAGSVLVFVR